MAGLKPELNFKLRSPLALLGLLLLVSIFALASGWGHLLSRMNNRDLAERIGVQAFGLQPAQTEEIALWFEGPEGEAVELTHDPSAFQWRTEFWVPELRVSATRGALASLRQLQVNIGAHRFSFDAAQIAGWEKAPTPRLIGAGIGGDIVSLQIPLPRSEPIAMVNWPADRSTLGIFLYGALWLPLAFISAVVFWWAAKSPRFRSLATRALSSALGPQNQDRRWTVYGFGFVLICLVFMEWRQPYYFTQDDDYSQFLPVIAGACRSFFSGHLPLWNPYQYLGAPVMTLGVYALTYPFTYVAWSLAALLGNEYLTIEILSIGHIVAGYFISVHMLARVGFRPATAASGAASLVLSGFALVFGRSWYYMLPVLVWAPLLVLAVERLCDPETRAGWRWALTTGLVIGMFFHAGNAQMWAYGLIFFCVAIALSVYARRVSLKQALWALPALLTGLALAAPVLLAQMGETADIKRSGGHGQSILNAVPHLFLPLGSLVPHPEVWVLTQRSNRGEMFYVGFPFILATTAGIFLLIGAALFCRANGKALRHLAGHNTWLICAALAWILALAHPGVLWIVMSWLPVFDKFNVPAKFIGFLVLFSVIAGGTLIERIFRQHSRAPILLACSVMALLLVHVGLATTSFYDFNGQPYPDLPRQFARILRASPPQRVLAIGPDRSMDSHTTTSLRNNYGTVEHVMTVEGYDPLVEARPEDRAAIQRADTDISAAARAYGTRWVLVDEGGFRSRSDENAGPMEITAPAAERRFARLRPSLRLVAWVPGYTLYELPDAAPLAFVKERPGVPLPVEMTWSGIRVDTAGIPANSAIILNVLGRRWMSLTSGKSSGLAWNADQWGRVSFTLPAATQSVSLNYNPPWDRGIKAGLALILIAFAFGALLSVDITARIRVSSLSWLKPRAPEPTGVLR